VIQKTINPRVALWLVLAAILAVPLILLTVTIEDGAIPSQDQTVLAWVVDRDNALVSGLSKGVTFLADNRTSAVLGVLGITFLWLIGSSRAAVGFGVVGLVIVGVAFLGDLILGGIVDHVAPSGDDTGRSFPSGHVFGATVFYGFWGFLGVYYGLKKKILVPLLALIVALILAVGFSRMFEQAHWPSDVAAGYLLGGLWLLLLIPSFLYFQRVSWLTSAKQTVDLTTLGCETCRIERSIASTVVLDPERGTATKTYNPPGVVRLLYWLAFQARFPYDHNQASLHAAMYRRKIASALTIHRFGKDLVAGTTAADCMLGECTFVTEYIAGEKVENDEETKLFLGQVAETFAEAGLGVWQINPRNPHAHTNVIRNHDGDLIIIDLESAVVTPIPAPGQWRSALRSGNIPIFDDIDFGRLRVYVSANEAEFAQSLGSDGLAQFKEDVDRGEEAIRSWQDSEPRLWGKLISGVYHLLDWKGFYKRFTHALKGADQAAENFLNRGIERWEAERRLSSSEAALLRSQVTSGECRNAMHHMGVHLVLSVALVVPIPGLRSLARFTWTAIFWVKVQAGRLLRRGPRTAARVSNIHSPLVMVLALVPLGGVAYMASRPLRRKALMRLMLDQVAIMLPFRLYSRLKLDKRLGPDQSAATPS